MAAAPSNIHKQYFKETHRKGRKNVTPYPVMLATLGEHLGIPAQALDLLEPAWFPIVEFEKSKSFAGFWGFPERDEAANIIGISLRSRDDRKPMLTGSKHGCFYHVNPAFLERREGSTPHHGEAENEYGDRWTRCKEHGLICPICEHPESDGCSVRGDPDDPYEANCCRISEEADRDGGVGNIHVLKPAPQKEPRGNANPGSPDEYPTIIAPGSDESNDMLVCVEGASDVAAILSLGFAGLGRPSNLAGMEYVVELCRGFGLIAFCVENDKKPNGDWPGERGAVVGAAKARAKGHNAGWFTLPDVMKDIRAGVVSHGLTTEGLRAIIQKRIRFDIPKKYRETASSPQKKQKQTECKTSAYFSDCELFRCDGIPYISFRRPAPVDDRATGSDIETVTVPISNAGTLIQYKYFSETEGGILGREERTQIKDALFSKALFGPDVPEKHATIRWGWNSDRTDRKMYFELVTPQRRIAEVSAEGYRELDSPPDDLRFIHYPTMLSYPPVADHGDMSLLADLLGITDKKSKVLLLAWLIGAMLPDRPRPILCLNSPSGTGKTTATKMIRGILNRDDSAVGLLPKKDKDIYIDALHSPVLSYDNEATPSKGISNTLCNITTGGVYKDRGLYTDDEQHVISVKSGKPIIINGIGDIADQSDLISRMLIVNLPFFDDADRKYESEMWDEYNRILPVVLRGFFNAVSEALRNLPSVVLDSKPRMADFMRWVVAAEPAMPWEPGDFLQVYRENRNEATITAMDSNPAAAGLLALLERNGGFEGTAEALYAEVDRLTTNPSTRSSPGFPKYARGMSVALDKMIPALKFLGYAVRRGIVKKKKMIYISKTVAAMPKMPPPRRGGQTE